MADSRISDLPELTSLANDDEFVVVDKSDTSMAGSGTTKRVTKAELEADVIAAHAANLSLHSSGREVDYAEITTGTTITAPGSTRTDVPGLTIDVPIGGRPVMVEFFAPSVAVTVANRIIQFWLSDGTQTHLFGIRYYELANESDTWLIKRRLPAPASAKSYQLKANIQSGLSGNIGISAGTGAADLATVPAYLNAVEC